MSSLAKAAAGLGSVVQVAHTAGLSPVQAPPAAILAVDLLGTALVVEEFGHVIAPSGAGVVISSMAGYMQPPLEPAQEQALAHTPADQLVSNQMRHRHDRDLLGAFGPGNLPTLRSRDPDIERSPGPCWDSGLVS